MSKLTRFEPGHGHIEGLASQIVGGLDVHARKFQLIFEQSRSQQLLPYFEFLRTLRTSTGMTKRSFGAENNLQVFESLPYGVLPNTDPETARELPAMWQRLVVFKAAGRNAVRGNLALVHVLDPGDTKGPDITMQAKPDEAVIVDRTWALGRAEQGNLVHYVDLKTMNAVATIYDQDETHTPEDRSDAITQITEGFVIEEFNELGAGVHRPGDPTKDRIVHILGATRDTVGAVVQSFRAGASGRER